MPPLTELQDLLLLSCGSFFFYSMIGSSLLLLVISLYLVIRLGQQHALTLFLPLTTFPFFIGAVRSLFTLSTAVTLLQSVGSNQPEATDGVMLLCLAVTPILFGGIAMIPAFTTTVMGRVWLAYAANRAPRKDASSLESRATRLAKLEQQQMADADDYVAQLTRGRS